jgi:diguanylate cyclase
MTQGADQHAVNRMDFVERESGDGIAEQYLATYEFAEIAFGQIKALKQPAHPRNYEVWYHYATGYHPAVNQLINQLLKTNGSLTQSDIDAIYDRFFSPIRQTTEIDNATSRFITQIDAVMSMLGHAADSSNAHATNLSGMNERLGKNIGPDGIRSIIETLISTARDMETSNRTLEQRLKSAKLEIQELHHHLEAVRTESLTDPLTTLANRKHFDASVAALVAEANQMGEPLSLVLADIDHFKAFNDTFGHLIGDQVLRLVALALKDNVKGRDIAARYGGEEFAVILPETSLRQATTVGEHIRRAVMGKELMKRSTGENLGRITVSVGVASLHRGESVAGLIERADNCLYAAKRNGRNRVICEVDPEISAAAKNHVA